MNNYFIRVWQSRFFWKHLALADLRSRWRRSFFGVFWSLLQPLGLTILLALVFSKIFNVDITTYAPYILSGIIVWDFLISNVTGGSLAFVQADAYIKQCSHPLAIYTLRNVISSIIVLMLTTIPLLMWSSIVLPENIGWSWLAVLSIYPILIFIAWPLSTLLAYICVRFRDIPHALALVMQAIWFISPVYFESKMFRAGGLDALVDYNPIYHILQIFRAPLLEGSWPTITNYLFCFVTIAFLSFIAWIVGRKAERKVIFYL